MIRDLALHVGKTALAGVILIALMEGTSAFYIWRQHRSER